MPQYKITHHPRSDTGNMLGMAPITFVTDIIVENRDKKFAPYRACDGSVWYPVLLEEIEELNETTAMKLEAESLGCKICDD